MFEKRIVLVLYLATVFFLSFPFIRLGRATASLEINYLTPHSSLNVAPFEVTVSGAGFVPETKVHLYVSGGEFQQVGRCNLKGADGLALKGGYAYVVHDLGLQIIDISDPANPELMGNIETPDRAFKVAADGDYVYIMHKDNVFCVINVSDPNHPELVGSTEVVPGMVEAHPAPIGRVDSPGWAMGVAVNGNYAYMADNSEGLQIIDISDPINPFIKVTYQTPGNASGVALEGNYAYVVSFSGLQVIDISDPADPISIGINKTVAGNDISLSGDYAYTGDWMGGFQVIDISNPASPTRVGGYQIPVHQVAVSGQYAYATSENGVYILQTLPQPCIPVVYNNSSTLSVTIPAHLPIGLYNVIVKNPDKTIKVLPNGFCSLCLDCDADGYTADEGDCDDQDPEIYPGVEEKCDGKDNNCDQIIPEDETDFDQDGYMICQADCDDYDTGIYPGAPEICDGKDNDCDEIIPQNEMDEDQDGYRICAGDCNDLDAQINSAKEEILYNGRDDDCNAATRDWPIKVSSVTPNSAINTSSVEVTVQGEGFVPEAEVHLSSSRGAYEVGSCDTPGYAHDVVIRGNYAYLADGEKGLQVIDITEPANPFIVRILIMTAVSIELTLSF